MPQPATPIPSRSEPPFPGLVSAASSRPGGGRAACDLPRAMPLDTLGPVVAVGQARCGSSLATLILNRFAGGFVINDAYAAQMAADLGAPGPLSPSSQAGRRDLSSRDLRALTRFRDAALARIAARGWAEDAGSGPPPIHRSAPLSPDQLAAAAEAGRLVLTDPDADWTRIWGAMLRASARAGGRRFWGWNTPPDHARADEILTAFPRARLLFVMRSPWAMLRSYRALPASWGEERARYHPALQARAWAAALRAHDRLAAERPGQVHLLRLEDLTGDASARAGALGALAAFLRAPEIAADPAALPANPSDTGPGLTRAEIAAARLGLGALASRAGPAPAPKGEGWALLARLSLRAGGYYARQAARSADFRDRLRRMARA